MRILKCQNPDDIPTVRWCLEDVLGLTDYDLQVEYNIDVHYAAGQFIPPKEISISKTIQGFDPIRVLFHELRHYFQFHTHMFDFDAAKYQRIIPPGTSSLKQNSIRYRDYKKYPWEIDANEFSINTFSRYWKEPVSTFQKLSQLPTR